MQQVQGYVARVRKAAGERTDASSWGALHAYLADKANFLDLSNADDEDKAGVVFQELDQAAGKAVVVISSKRLLRNLVAAGSSVVSKFLFFCLILFIHVTNSTLFFVARCFGSGRVFQGDGPWLAVVTAWSR